MQQISKEYYNMFMELKDNIIKSINDSNHVPSYIEEAENSLSITNDIIWSVDLPSTIFMSLVNYYNNENTFNRFFEKYKDKNAYHLFLYNYFVRRCAICHSCAILNSDMIELLKQFIAIYKDYNNGRFNEDAFKITTVRDMDSFEVSNIELNLAFINSIYNKDMIKAEQNRIILFNYPYFCDDFSEQDYTQQFYSSDYNTYWMIASQYISKRLNPIELSNILEIFELIHFENESKNKTKIEGGLEFIKYFRHYGFNNTSD